MRALLYFFAGSLGFLIEPENDQHGVPVPGRLEQDEPFRDEIYISSKTVKLIYISYFFNAKIGKSFEKPRGGHFWTFVEPI